MSFDRRHALATPLASALVATLTTFLLLGTLGLSSGNRRILNLLEELETKVDGVDTKLAAMDAKLDATHPEDAVFGLEVCVKGALGGEGGYAVEQELRIEAEGRVGAEAYGNGLMAKLRALPGAKLEGGAKGEVGGELSACFDLRALAQQLRARGAAPGISPDAAATIQRLAAVDQDELLEALATFVDATSLDPGAFAAALERVRTLPSGIDPGSIGHGELVASLAEVLPLPAQHRARLLDPGAMLASFQDDRVLCELQGLPPALAEIVDQACAGAAAENLADIIVGTQSKLDALQSSLAAARNAIAAVPANVVNAICNVIPGC